MRGFLIVLAAMAAFATANAKAATTSAPMQQAAADAPATTAASPTGDYRKTWKVGPNSYGFEGVSGGCHYSGSVSPSGYHLDRTC